MQKPSISYLQQTEHKIANPWLTWPMSQVITISLLAVILVGYNAFFITYSLQKHAAFQTAGFDLGNYDQALWNTLQDKPLAMTTTSRVSSRWAAHFEPILLLFVPIYAAFPFPQTLLVLQTVVISLGAIPIFLLAKWKLNSVLAGFVFTIVYLLFPALQAALVFDFHALAIASALLSFALLFLNLRRYYWFTVMILLAMCTKEEVSLIIFMMGIYIWLVQRNWRWGIATIAVGALWFALVNFIFIPAMSPTGENIQLNRYNQWGDNLGLVITNLLVDPSRPLQVMFSGDQLNYWIRSTMPVAFTALLDPLILLMTLPTMVINTLSSYPPNYQLDQFHYSVNIVPFVVVGSINGLARLIRWAGPRFTENNPKFLLTALLLMVLTATFMYQVQFGHTPLGQRFFKWPVLTQHHLLTKEVLAQIPPQAAVAAQNNLVPHLSRRDQIYILPKTKHQNRPADYIVLDMQSPLSPYKTTESYCSDVNEFLTSPHYGLIFSNDGLLLFKRGVSDTATFEPTKPCQ